MRAVVIDEFGGPEVLHMADITRPKPGSGQVLVQVSACGMCGFDVMSRSGVHGYGVHFPVILGHEFAGEVVEIGEGVTDFKIGDRVAALQQVTCNKPSCEYCSNGRETLCLEGTRNTYGAGHKHGGYAEACVADTGSLVKVPDEVPMTEAAIAACAIGTVIHAMELAQVKMGERVVVTGAGGGLGIHALQLARANGCETIAVTSSPEKIDVISNYADRVVTIEDGKYSGPRINADVVLELTAGFTLNHSIHAVKRGGRIVIIGNLTSEGITISPGAILAREVQILGSNGTSRKDLRNALELLRRKVIKPNIAEILPLEQAGDGHRRMGDRSVFGRLVLDPSIRPAAG